MTQRWRDGPAHRHRAFERLAPFADQIKTNVSGPAFFILPTLMGQPDRFTGYLAF